MLVNNKSQRDEMMTGVGQQCQMNGDRPSTFYLSSMLTSEHGPMS